MDKNKILEERKKWYSQTFVLLEIVKCLKNRELAFISAKGELPKRVVRYMWAFAVDYLKKHFEWDYVNFYNNLINIYHSVAVIKGKLSYFSYNMNERMKDEKYQDFNKNYIDYVEGFNFFLDIDGKENPKDAYKDTQDIKKLFDDAKIPYYLLNSSLTGFHIHIPIEYMPKMKPEELLRMIGDVIYNLKGIYEFKCLDDSIADLKRICKVPYSYVCDGSIALPLSNYEFENFSPEKVKMEYILSNIMIKNRGLKIRTHGLDEEQLKKNVLQFLNNYK